MIPHRLRPVQEFEIESDSCFSLVIIAVFFIGINSIFNNFHQSSAELNPIPINKRIRIVAEIIPTIGNMGGKKENKPIKRV